MESSESRRAAMSVEIRACHSHEEFRACREIQRAVWNDFELDVPFPLFVVASEIGGQVIGAFEDGRMAGFSLALPALRNGRAYLHSHMTAVRPDAQNRGIGRGLKLTQRKHAIERGIDWIEWTFDPLEIRNGHFNLTRLGAVARRYIPNCYGVTTSPLHGGLPTDRLVAEWELRSERVERRLRKEPADSEFSNRAERVAVPASISEIKRSDPAQARQIQNRARDEFQQWFGRGYEAAGIEIGADSAEYILEPRDARRRDP
jgi:predicted GNAT superfamily acetyltransferase